ncbi:MAG: hypothetical protein LBE62_14165 [Azonexus sp.]|jgi:hypothetical protein|nr:hypothetical protein [Azonexus sp.]
MKHHTIFTACLVAFAGNSVADDLRGKIFPPYPEDWKDTSAKCISNRSNDGNDKNCDYYLGSIQINGKYTLVLFKPVQSTDSKNPSAIITDHMPAPKVPKGYFYIDSPCKINDHEDKTIIAVVKMADGSVHSAWRANLTTERFEVIPTKGIQCN